MPSIIKNMSMWNLNRLYLENLKKAVVFECEFDPENFIKNIQNQLILILPEELRGACIKRKAEFLAGRVVAMQALNELGFEKFFIRIGKNGAPIWPENVVGSISHSNKRAIALVRFSYGCLGGVGIDIEAIIDENIAADINRSIITNEESLVISYKLGFEFNYLLTLVFSAKESLFKALSPEVQQYFDFLDVQTTDISSESMTFKLVRDLTINRRCGDTFKVYFQAYRKHVLTYVDLCSC